MLKCILYYDTEEVRHLGVDLGSVVVSVRIHSGGWGKSTLRVGQLQKPIWLALSM